MRDVTNVLSYLKKVKFNVASVVELSKTANFVCNFLILQESYTKEQLWWLANFRFEFFFAVFTEGASVLLLGAKKVKTHQNLKSRGPVLTSYQFV